MKTRTTKIVDVDDYMIMELVPGTDFIIVNAGELEREAYAIVGNRPHFTSSRISIHFLEVRKRRSWQSRETRILVTSSDGSCYVEEGRAPHWWLHGHVDYGGDQ